MWKDYHESGYNTKNCDDVLRISGKKNRDSRKGIPILLLLSGREDSNLRPHGPEPCALARLRYAPYLFKLRRAFYHAEISPSNIEAYGLNSAGTPRPFDNACAF